MADVFIDNKFMGTVKDAFSFAERFISERRMNRIDLSTNINVDKRTNNVYIETSLGRTVRPLIVVKEGKSLLTKKHYEQLKKNEIAWSDLIKQGIIEYLDSAEEENAYVCLEEKELSTEHTHLEINSTALVGIATGFVPFGHHNPGPRLLQGSKNQKQSIGFYAANFPLRMDMDSNLLHYPQVPIVSSVIYDLSEYEKHPSGQNVVVAVMSFQGYNIEDAVILNQGSLDRGFGRSTYYNRWLLKN
jgi:DNA-directed RNA polymerase beta subunit